MPDLQIQYARSADGTRIALATIGRGRPFILVANQWIGSMEVLWGIPTFRDNVERLAQRRTVVLYDHRGQGLSERVAEEFSLQRRLEDLLAVRNHTSDVPAAVGGHIFGAIVAAAFAARFPDVVSRLVLWNPLTSGREFQLSPTTRALMTIAESDWEFYVRAQAVVDFGWTEAGLRAGAKLASSVGIDVMTRTYAAGLKMDVSNDLQQIRCPTLVIHSTGGRHMPLSTSQDVAAAIPGARSLIRDSDVSTPLVNLADDEVRLLEDFLNEEQVTADVSERKSSAALPSGMTAILFADIADSTALTERLGDTAFRAKARELSASLRALIRECGGTPVEGPTLGDGVLAVFTSAREAIEAAVACGEAGSHAGLPLHLGVHAGDVTREQDPDGRANVYGGAVNIASRISGLSAPGEVLVSETVRSLARTSAGVRFEDRGEQALKGVGEAVRVWAVVEGAA